MGEAQAGRRRRGGAEGGEPEDGRNICVAPPEVSAKVREGRTDGRTDARMDGWMDGSVHLRTYVSMHGWMDGWS
eukprot:1883765-Rhodomonas_salina.1